MPIEQAGQQAEMMTFAALAYTGSTTAPSGESLADQEKRILTGIRAQLPQAAPGWDATWLGLTNDRANLAFVARSQASPTTAVVGLRGTVLSIFDLVEDLDVATMVEFSIGGTRHGQVSRGAMEAFTATVMGTDLATALAEGGAVEQIYLTGHSLGGALVTMVAPYLAAQFPQATVLPFTFAAPTAGDHDFATSFTRQFAAQCVVNRYDLIPYAWSKLSLIAWDLFPDSDHTVTAEVMGVVGAVEATLGQLVYVQPMPQQTINDDYGLRLALVLAPASTHPAPTSSPIDTFELWIAEAEFQHLLSTYLQALGTAPLADGPVVESISPPSGPSSGGTPVTIAGTGFTGVTHVDFGVAAGVDVVVESTESIIVKSPPGAGSVEVTVTTELGTSAGQAFTFEPA